MTGYPEHRIAEAVGQAVRDHECGEGFGEFCNAAGMKREGKECPCERTANAVLAALKKVDA